MNVLDGRMMCISRFLHRAEHTTWTNKKKNTRTFPRTWDGIDVKAHKKKKNNNDETAFGQCKRKKQTKSKETSTYQGH